MKWRRSVKAGVTGVSAALVLFSWLPAAAASANTSYAYRSDKAITNGSMVSLDPARSDYVQLANVDNAKQLLGVAVASDDSLIAVGSAPGRVQVATGGSAAVLVSNVNGDIRMGDQIAASPFDGIGMAALPGSRTIGLAQTAFNARTPGAATKKVTDKNGQTSSIRVGYIQASVDVSTNANPAYGSLNGLQRLAQTATGRVIATERVAVSLVVAVVALLGLMALVYASIHGSIISVGRNPLAKYAVLRTLGRVLAVALLITVIAGMIIFLLLK